MTRRKELCDAPQWDFNEFIGEEMNFNHSGFLRNVNISS